MLTSIRRPNDVTSAHEVGVVPMTPLSPAIYDNVAYEHDVPSGAPFATQVRTSECFTY